ncbi:hypothetical protein GCM10017764_02820 [Sphingobacterium griseoflavum]|uniref:Uncharacterized protein n=1 Tax=Sphingobacterium griseoflavum TaxID=1474952 RepID=A0ABQ3HR46_9SPHI|nr:hypothetical protein GCM10017764_02820 [Sphingobacterium griseoflavum]
MLSQRICFVAIVLFMTDVFKASAKSTIIITLNGISDRGYEKHPLEIKLESITSSAKEKCLLLVQSLWLIFKIRIRITFARIIKNNKHPKIPNSA